MELGYGIQASNPPPLGPPVRTPPFPSSEGRMACRGVPLQHVLCPLYLPARTCAKLPSCCPAFLSYQYRLPWTPYLLLPNRHPSRPHLLPLALDQSAVEEGYERYIVKIAVYLY